MNCIIPSGNMKIVSKALHTLGKIGDELYIEAKLDYLQFATINQSKTAYITFNFDSMFFSSYEMNNNENGALACKVYMKAVLNIFKTKSPKDKMIDSCKIEFDIDPSLIIFKLRYKEDITVVHSIKLIDMEFVSVAFDHDNILNKIIGTGNFFTQVLNNFQTSDNDMSLEAKNNKIIVRNYDVGSNNVGKSIRSEVAINANEFMSYSIRQETHITVCFKPFRAAITFAEMFNLQVVTSFNSGGRPVNMTIKSSTFEANFILSTISPDGYTQTCSNLTPIAQNRSTNVELSREDRTLLETLNWDSDFEIDENDILLNEPKKTTDNAKDNTEIAEDVIPESPESPRSKKLRLVFGRCLEATYHPSKLDFGDELAPNSDSE